MQGEQSAKQLLTSRKGSWNQIHDQEPSESLLPPTQRRCTSPQNRISSANLEKLPAEVLEMILHLSLELGLIHTCRYFKAALPHFPTLALKVAFVAFCLDPDPDSLGTELQDAFRFCDIGPARDRQSQLGKALPEQINLQVKLLRRLLLVHFALVQASFERQHEPSASERVARQIRDRPRRLNQAVPTTEKPPSARRRPLSHPRLRHTRGQNLRLHRYQAFLLPAGTPRLAGPGPSCPDFLPLHHRELSASNTPPAALHGGED
jgi:hypothetical protein